MKTAPIELLVDSVLGPFGVEGVCDPRFVTNWALTEVQTAGGDVRAMWELQKSTYAWDDDAGAPSFLPYDLAATAGGCSGRRPRSGVAFGFQHERLVTELCKLAPEESGTELFVRLLGRVPTSEEQSALEGAPDPESTCRAIAGSAEVFFY